MKIKPDHYKILKEAVLKVIADNPTAYQDYQEEGLSNKRYNWDLLHTSSIKIHDKNTTPTIKTRFCLPLYDYMNDNHIETALKNITGKR